MDENRAHLAPPAGFRTAPHNIEAEQALLGAILINNGAYHRVAEFLRPEHFYEPVHQRIFAVMERLIEDGRLADYLTLKASFDDDTALRELDGAQYLARLARAAETIINARDYGLAIHDLARRRDLIAIAEEATNMAHDTSDGVPSAGDQIQRLQASIDRLAMDQPAENWMSVADVAERIIERLGQPDECYTTGLPTLDRSMSGGIHPGLVYGIEARPKQAKSMLLGTIQLALMRQNCPSLFLALEMGSMRILERMIAHESNCNAVRFRKNEDRADLIGRVQAFGNRYGSRRAYFVDDPGIAFRRLTGVATAAVQKLGIRALFLDYYQLVTGLPKGQSKADFLADVAQWVAAFAAANHCAVIIASQENRGGESYGSDGLAKACDWLAVLHKVDSEDRMAGQFEALWLDVKFNRDGMDGCVGTDAEPAFRIDKIGPVVREFGDW